MTLELAGVIQLESTTVDGRVITRLVVDGREIAASPEILRAIAAAMSGGTPDPSGIDALIAEGLVVRTARQPLPATGVLTLSARATIESTFAAQRGPHGPVVPDTSLPLSLFVPPSILGPLQLLAARLRDAWRSMASASVSRGRLPDPDEVAGVLERRCRELVSDPALAAIVRVDGERLVPLVALQRDDVCYPLDRLVWHADRSPAHDKRPAGRIAVRGPSVAQIGTLLGRLAAGIDANELGALLAGGHPLLSWIASYAWFSGQLEERARRSHAIAPGTVMHLGHATLLANLGGAHVLVDPWLPPASAGDAVAPPAPCEMPPLAAILITHHHWDHVHVDTLLRLDKRIPIYVPRQANDRVLAPRTTQLLRYLGFSTVIELGHGESVPVGDEGEVIAAPFFGEDPTCIGYAGNTYVLRHGARAALVHVDSGTDLDGRSLVTSGDAARLVDRFGPLDPVFATRRQERGMMIEHTWESMFQPFARWGRPTENCDNGADFLAALARATRTPRLVLYSEGGADWYPEGTDFLRTATPSTRSEPHEYLWDSLAAIRERVGVAVPLSAPFDTFLIGAGDSR